MALPNDSLQVTTGTGPLVASHTPSGSSVEFQTVVIADDSGHMYSTKPTYTWWVPSQTAAASKSYADIFNAVGSGKILEIQGIWCIAKSDVAVTSSIAVGFNLIRTSTVGSGGTAHTYNGGSSEASHVITPWDTTNAAPPAGITARQAPSGGATTSAFYWPQYILSEETNAAVYISAFSNLLPMGMMRQPLTLREGQGLIIKENSNATGPVGSFGFLTIFTLV